MKTLKNILLLCAFFAFMACTENENFGVNEDDQLIGYWINPVYNDSTITYEKANSLKENDYGFTIKANQQFEERKNSGWCGTPPISYADYEGTWSYNDSILQIEVEYWGGMANYTWKVMMVDQYELIIYPIDQEFEMNKENI